MVAVEELITENIDIWTSAVKRKSSAGRGGGKKIELYGVKKLRELILDLAVRGLLVPQDPNDEPASVLLERIATEKTDLVAAKIIKKQKPLPSIAADETLFKLPSGWSWARLGDIGLVASSSRVHQKDWTDAGVPFYRAREIVKLSNNDPIKNALYISEDKFTELSENGSAPVPLDIMITGVGTIGIPYIVQEKDRFYFKDASVLVFKNHHHLNPKYLFKIMTSPYWSKRTHDGSMGTTVHTLTISRSNSIAIPIAPPAEQHRIVAKVDELMALCDQLEQQTESSLTAHKTLVQTLLGALTQAAATLPKNDRQTATDAPTPFTQAWNRLAEHFDTIFTTEDSIDQLKQTILQLAVMGKLVPQDPNDEPASELLKRIAAEKAELVKAKKIKKQKALPEIGEEEKPFGLPDGWEWTRVGNISLLNGGFAYKSKQFTTDSLYQVIRMGNIRPDFLRIDENPVFIELAYASSTQDYEIVEGDILLTMTGTKGKRDYLYTLLVSKQHLVKKRLFLNQRLCIIRPISVADNYINSVLKDDRMLDAIYAKSTGSANQANIGMEAISEWIIPLPPLSQQRRVVAKIDELIAICDQLKARLTDAQATQLQLADAVTKQATH